MSATTTYQTFSDLYTALQVAVRVTTGVTATENIAKRLINVALHDCHVGMDYRFPWCERSAILRTQAQYTTGTLTATKGSTTLEGSGTAWNTNNDFSVKNMRAGGKVRIAGALDPYTISRTLTATKGSTTLEGSGTAWNTNNDFSVKNMRAGGKVRIAGALDPYTISSVTDDDTAVLSAAFVETTVTDGTYTYYEDEYALASDFLRPVDMQRFSDAIPIDLISRTEFRRRYPSNSVPQTRPSVACIIDAPFSSTTTPVRRVRFAPPPSSNVLIPYTYITSNLAVSSAGVAAANLSADTDEPIVPLRYRGAI